MDGEQAFFEREDRCGVRTLVVAGEIDLATAPAFRRQLDALINDAHSPAFVDLTGVTFLDSSGLSVLVHARRALAAGDVELVLLNPSRLVRKVLEVSGIGALFEIRCHATKGDR